MHFRLKNDGFTLSSNFIFRLVDRLSGAFGTKAAHIFECQSHPTKKTLECT